MIAEEDDRALNLVQNFDPFKVVPIKVMLQFMIRILRHSGAPKNEY